MPVARNRVGSDFIFHCRPPFGVGTLRGVDFHSGVGVGFAPCLGEIHGAPVGGERHDSFVKLGVQLTFNRFGALPFPFLVLAANPYVAFFHSGYLAFFCAGNFFVCRSEIEGVGSRRIKEHGGEICASRIEQLGVFHNIACRMPLLRQSETASGQSVFSLLRRFRAGCQEILVGFLRLGIFPLGL